MYYSQELAERIKSMARKNNVVLGKMLSECGLNANTLNQISEERGIASFSLGKIADYLDCSVDYLLCRTDNPNVNKMRIGNADDDQQLMDIINIYKQLDNVGRAKALVAVDEILKGGN